MNQTSNVGIGTGSSRSREAVSHRSTRIAFLLALLPGLLGTFGLGHLYLGRRTRGLVFLGYTAVLYSVTAVALFFPIIAPMPTLPTAWFIGFVAQLYDVRRPVGRHVPLRQEARVT